MGPRVGLGGCGKFRLHREFSLYSLVLCLSLIPICFVFLIVLHFTFCLYVHHTHQTFMLPAGFELAIPASVRPQTLALDCSATGINIRSPDRCSQRPAIVPTPFHPQPEDVLCHNDPHQLNTEIEY